MSKKGVVVSSVIFLLLSAETSFPNWFWPTDYNECILKNMKGVTNNGAVANIVRACRAKFPNPINDDVSVSITELRNITGTGTLGSGNTSFGGTFYNANSDWSISKEPHKYCCS